MTKLWKQAAIGAAVVGGVALATYLWMPARMAAASMMGSGMMNGGMAAMMEGHMKDGKMDAMMEMLGGDMAAMMEMMGEDMMANMDKMHEAMAPMHQKELEATAKVLGMTTDDLSKALADGKSADSLAKEKNVDSALITSALAEVRTAAFADMVSAGTLTREQADKMLEHMNQVGSATLGAAAMMQGESCHSHMSPAK